LDLAALTALLARNGFVAAEEEAAELLEHARSGDLDAAIERRLTGEPLAWITGTAPFCGAMVLVRPGVYVPRWQTELLAQRGRALLAPGMTAVDLCTGCGAVATVLARSGARVLATDVEPAAIACAVANGVEAHAGDLFAPLDAALRGTVDVVTGVVPYVPTPELHLLQRDTFTFETTVSYDGGPDGCAILRRAIAGAAAFLRPGGTLLLELGGDEAALVAPDLTAAGFAPPALLRDEDGDLRGVEATLAA
jgi:release factor glutamine methyltransferase